MALGRKTRQWNTAQRRAISVRDGGHCRVYGCTNHRVDIHHLLDWVLGGDTDIANGCCLCAAHHTMVHQGRLKVTGNGNGDLTWRRADNTLIGVTRPPGNPTRLFA